MPLTVPQRNTLIQTIGDVLHGDECYEDAAEIIETLERECQLDGNGKLVGGVRSALLALAVPEGAGDPASDLANEPTCRRCGCTERAACVGGCHWAVPPDPVTLFGTCSSCAAKAAAEPAA